MIGGKIGAKIKAMGGGANRDGGAARAGKSARGSAGFDWQTLNGPQVIVGLGNPGQEYENTRHNSGFLTVDELAAQLGASYWKLTCSALVAETSYQGSDILLVKPQTFMNLSGKALKGLVSRYGFSVSDILVVHDELDLPAGSVRLKIGGGHGGHNGLRSIHATLGDSYARLRIGIGRPPGRMPADIYVLQQLKGPELVNLQIAAKTAADCALLAIEKGVLLAMNECNRDA